MERRVHTHGRTRPAATSDRTGRGATGHRRCGTRARHGSGRTSRSARPRCRAPRPRPARSDWTAPSLVARSVARPGPASRADGRRRARAAPAAHVKQSTERLERILRVRTRRRRRREQQRFPDSRQQLKLSLARALDAGACSTEGLLLSSARDSRAPARPTRVGRRGPCMFEGGGLVLLRSPCEWMPTASAPRRGPLHASPKLVGTPRCRSRGGSWR